MGDRGTGSPQLEIVVWGQSNQNSLYGVQLPRHFSGFLQFSLLPSPTMQLQSEINTFLWKPYVKC